VLLVEVEHGVARDHSTNCVDQTRASTPFSHIKPLRSPVTFMKQVSIEHFAVSHASGQLSGTEARPNGLRCDASRQHAAAQGGQPLRGVALVGDTGGGPEALGYRRRAGPHPVDGVYCVDVLAPRARGASQHMVLLQARQDGGGGGFRCGWAGCELHTATSLEGTTAFHPPTGNQRSACAAGPAQRRTCSVVPPKSVGSTA
jgi:hypothetical protein